MGIWSGLDLAVSERLDKGIRKGGGTVEIKFKKKEKKIKKRKELDD